jgi:hypothetical protein
MDSVDVFRQLGGGVRFDKRKYADDIDFFKVRQSHVANLIL